MHGVPHGRIYLGDHLHHPEDFNSMRNPIEGVLRTWLENVEVFSMKYVLIACGEVLIRILQVEMMNKRSRGV